MHCKVNGGKSLKRICKIQGKYFNKIAFFITVIQSLKIFKRLYKEIFGGRPPDFETLQPNPIAEIALIFWLQNY